MNLNLIEKIKEKREFSQLRLVDIENVFVKFSNQSLSDQEKLEKTKEELRILFSAFISKKLLSLKDKDPEWILRKHISTKERLPFYTKLYSRILFNLNDKKIKNCSIIDLGSGINGFSYSFFNNGNINYLGIDSVGQLIKLMNFYFNKKKFNAKAVHLSLFELEELKDLIQKQKKPRIIFLFKVIDALESIQKDYSKKLLFELSPLTDKFVLSFPTKSLGNKSKFKSNRKWILDFISKNFLLLDEFEFGGEKYLVFKNL